MLKSKKAIFNLIVLVFLIGSIYITLGGNGNIVNSTYASSQSDVSGDVIKQRQEIYNSFASNKLVDFGDITKLESFININSSEFTNLAVKIKITINNIIKARQKVYTSLTNNKISDSKLFGELKAMINTAPQAEFDAKVRQINNSTQTINNTTTQSGSVYTQKIDKKARQEIYDSFASNKLVSSEELIQLKKMINTASQTEFDNLVAVIKKNIDNTISKRQKVYEFFNLSEENSNAYPDTSELKNMINTASQTEFDNLAQKLREQYIVIREKTYTMLYNMNKSKLNVSSEELTQLKDIINTASQKDFMTKAIRILKIIFGMKVDD